MIYFLSMVCGLWLAVGVLSAALAWAWVAATCGVRPFLMEVRARSKQYPPDCPLWIPAASMTAVMVVFWPAALWSLLTGG